MLREAELQGLAVTYLFGTVELDTLLGRGSLRIPGGGSRCSDAEWALLLRLPVGALLDVTTPGVFLGMALGRPGRFRP